MPGLNHHQARWLTPDLIDCFFGFGQTWHQRQRPVTRSFRYRSFFVDLNVPAQGRSAGNRLFGINRPALLSFQQADHGDGNDPFIWISKLLKDAGLKAPERLRYRGFVRVFGYAFKPVSFWFCINKNGERYAVIAEVNNTFSQRHFYLLESGGKPLPESQELISAKEFHVSPFFPRSGSYRFRFIDKDDHSVAKIDYYDEHGLMLATSLAGAHRRITQRNIAKAVFAYPLFTVGVIARIHWQAVLLWLKRIPFHTKPEPVPNPVSQGGPAMQQTETRTLYDIN